MSENDIIKKNDFDASVYGFDAGIVLNGYDLIVGRKNNEFVIWDIKDNKPFLNHAFVAVDLDKFSEDMLPVAEKKDGNRDQEVFEEREKS